MLQVDPDLVPPTGVDPDASEADSAREGATPRVVRKDLDVCLGRLPARANRSGLVGQGSSNIDPRSDASEPCRHHTVADNKVFSSHRMGIQLPADAIETLESRACQDQSRAWHIQPVDEAIIEVLVVAQRARLWRRTGLEEGGETLADDVLKSVVAPSTSQPEGLLTTIMPSKSASREGGMTSCSRRSGPEGGRRARAESRAATPLKSSRSAWSTARPVSCKHQATPSQHAQKGEGPHKTQEAVGELV
eukprot:CAMPEP_0180691368 /NCGR_PEP_ID=MMETSP1038_2-20121128/199_1 /TAXON_ID=632150 /ORGANISM="Azadinium spinosum, Strain 3D9" /LENGTH=247 /DNA_ID=CAMNT_0022722357 /DNA_START=53 /DNA_END=797 /DNA_ORIENTATION=-